MSRRSARIAALAAPLLLAPLVVAGAGPGSALAGDDTPVLLTPKGEVAEEVSEAEEASDFAKLRDA
jgi:hypothetical protein